MVAVNGNEKPQNVLKLTEKNKTVNRKSAEHTSPVSKKKAKSSDNKIRKLKTTPNFTRYHRHQKQHHRQSWP